MNYIFSRRGVMFVISSPSGAGKTTICNFLLNKYSSQLKMSISVTTRPKRPNEQDGIDYYFLSREQFLSMRQDGDFLEYAEVFKHFYGTPKKFVYDTLAAGYDVLFDIDWQGADQLAKVDSNDLVRLFILPPSIQELSSRLQQRGQDHNDVMSYRLKSAYMEITQSYKYDFVLINDDLQSVCAKVSCIYESECLRRDRLIDLECFVKNLCYELS